MERNQDAGHTHGKTPYFVTGCPLCDAEKATRNQAIEHLSEALHLLQDLSADGSKPRVRLNLGPVGVTGDDISLCRSFDVTAKTVEKLADAISAMNAHTMAQPPALPLPEQVDAETIAEITGVFNNIDAREMTKAVLDHRQVDMVYAIEVLDDVFGDIVDPYAAEDDD
ncbi:hypothetical protein [Streptomyces sp. NPDC007074]|uniref:hypothetical protein n=1 Tax=Streptomyces sp. NPDC007074 TaxID=3156764 RepID=UPI0033FFDDF2